MAEQTQVLMKEPMEMKVSRGKTKSEWENRGTVKNQDGQKIPQHETGVLDFYDFEFDKMKAERKNALIWAQEAALSNKKYFRMDEEDLGPLTSNYEKH